MILSILLGILSSIVAEVIVYINKKLSGTVLAGKGSFLLAFGVAYVGAFIKLLLTPGFSFVTLADWNQITIIGSQVFTVSQVYFYFIMKTFKLDIQEGGMVRGV